MLSSVNSYLLVQGIDQYNNVVLRSESGEETRVTEEDKVFIQKMNLSRKND